MAKPRIKDIHAARRTLANAIEAAYCRRDEYDHPDPATRQRREDRAALKLLVTAALDQARGTEVERG